MSVSNTIRKYIHSYTADRRWLLVAQPTAGIENVIVIPALAESAHIFDTLASLADNHPKECGRTLVIVVVNNRPSEHCSADERMDNAETMKIMRLLIDREDSGDAVPCALLGQFEKVRRSALRLGFIDAASPGCEMPFKNGGVGLARKIGLDRGLEMFDYEQEGVKLLFFLDADTLVEKNYLQSVRSYFEETGNSAAVISHNHQKASDDREQAAILCYEIFLCYYVLGLRYAGSPYGFHSIGSTIVCTPQTYAGVRGMNKRKAGEDFYFLNKLAKSIKIGKIYDTMVFPSSRPSTRVPFGTGKRVRSFLNGESEMYVLYDPCIFFILRQWRLLISGLPENTVDILNKAYKIHPLLAAFLRDIQFEDVWLRLKANSTSDIVLLRHFDSWFDGFRTLKLINFLSRNGIPPVAMFPALTRMLAMMGEELPYPLEGLGIPSLRVQAGILQFLRTLESNEENGQ